MLVSADIPGNLLLDMVESYITSGCDDSVPEAVPVIDGQMSLLDYGFCV